MLDDAAVIAAELQRALARRQAVDGIEEGVEVHEAPELAVGDDLEAEPLLPGDHPADRVVLELVQAGQVLGALLREQRGMPGLVDAMDLVEQGSRALQAADVVCPDGP